MAVSLEKPTSPKAKKAKVAEKPPEFTCDHCKKSFAGERSFLAHMCAQKIRWQDRDSKHVKLGFYVYSSFHAINYRHHRPKTYEDFVVSTLYTDFVKFARYLLDIHAINPKDFIKFLFDNNVKMKNWRNPKTYETYVRELNKKESPDAAVERNILLMLAWSAETGEVWTEFFRKINPNRAVTWIQSGRISPWLLFLCSSAPEMFSRLSEEQVEMVYNKIDPDFWRIRMERDAETVAKLQEEFSRIGL
jgi:hypothetical protein